MDFSHHAYLVKSSTLRDTELLTELKKAGVAIEGNPDLLIREYDTFGIEDARGLKSQAVFKPLTDRRIFILIVGEMTEEAQNALLKLFEEPISKTHFFLMIRPGISLLPTLESRLTELVIADWEREKDDTAERFLKAYPAERTTYMTPIIEASDRVGAERFLNDLLLLVRMKADLLNDRGEGAKALESIMTARRLLIEKGASIKQVLEYVVSAVPRLT